MNTATQAANFKIDDLLASRLTNAADDGVVILDPSRSIHYSSLPSFSVNNGTAVDQAVKKARRENISFQVLNKRHDASNALKSSSLQRAKRTRRRYYSDIEKYKGHIVI